MPVTLEQIEPGIGLLQVDRPEARNAMNWRDMDAFAACVEEAHRLGELGALVVSGAGQAFIAGGDLKELHNYPTTGDAERLGRTLGAALLRLEALPCPVIAALNGPARGGGAEIALACDLRVLAENASLGLVQVTLGLTPAWGASQRLLRLVGYSRALDLLTSGRVIDAAEALSLGLANRLAPAGNPPQGGALPAALELARSLAGQPRPAVQAIKRLLQASPFLTPEQALAAEHAEFIPLWISDDHRKAVERFLRARKER